MNIEEKIEFIDDFLMRCEDWMHGKDGKDVTLSRHYLIDVRKYLETEEGNQLIQTPTGSLILSPNSTKEHCEKLFNEWMKENYK